LMAKGFINNENRKCQAEKFMDVKTIYIGG
jgi:hypothetical protein